MVGLTFIRYNEIPVYSVPEIMNEIVGNFLVCFGEILWFTHFMELTNPVYFIILTMPKGILKF